LSRASNLRLIFAGTPEFARVALERLHAAGFEIALILTQPDRPGGRGMKLQTSAVKQFALVHNIPLAQPRSLRLDGKYPDDARLAREAIEGARADVMVVAAYGLILPQWVLDVMSADGPPLGAKAPSGGSAVHEVTSVGATKLGCLNIHASLLPRWRGAAPIHRAIEAGDAQTGVTIMQMDAGLDTGDMLLVEKLPIAPTDTTGQLHDKVAALGGRLIVEALELAACGGLHPVKQPGHGATYAHKIEKQEAAIDWNQSADVIVRRIRAFDPFPGAHAVLAGETLKVWAAEAVAQTPPPSVEKGTILVATIDGITVVATNSIVKLIQLQRAGGKRLSAANFLHGFDMQPGMRFEHNAANPI
jgi:methionyl-tRNA formyltransferase